MKLFASLLAVGILAAPSAFAQSYTSPGPACRPGDLNCPAPLAEDNQAPIQSGRSATEVAPPNDPMFGRSGRPVQRSEESVRRDGSTSMDGRYPDAGSGNSNR